MKLIDETDALLAFLEQRDLSPDEACAVMGTAIVSLLHNENDERKRLFLRTLETQLMEAPANDR